MTDDSLALGVPADYAARGLAPHPEATDLVAVPCGPDDGEILMTPATRTAFLAMRDAAARDGVTLMIRHGFRSVKQQAELIRLCLANGKTIEQALTMIAAPGYSEHHTGRALDIGSDQCFPPTEDFERTSAFGWLQDNAARFGFTLSYPRGNPYGVIYEPWHWFHRDHA